VRSNLLEGKFMAMGDIISIIGFLLFMWFIFGEIK
jgi:hypothetical protein